MEIKLKEAHAAVAPNGPLRIQGNITLVHPDGRKEERNKVSLCRCGESTKMPFCDGMHKKIAFEG